MMTQKLKCVKKEIMFDGVHFWFRDNKLQKAPEHIIFANKNIPRQEVDHIKDKIVNNVCGV